MHSIFITHIFSELSEDPFGWILLWVAYFQISISGLVEEEKMDIHCAILEVLT